MASTTRGEGPYGFTLTDRSSSSSAERPSAASSASRKPPCGSDKRAPERDQGERGEQEGQRRGGQHDGPRRVDLAGVERRERRAQAVVAGLDQLDAQQARHGGHRPAG